jgi:hypothetical protein
VQQHSGDDHDAAAPEGEGVAPVGKYNGLQVPILARSLSNGVGPGLTKGSGTLARTRAKLVLEEASANMIFAVGLLIVGGVLTVSAAVVLLSLASETEMLPSLRHSGALGDEAPHSPRTQRNASDAARHARTRISLTQ